jgi:DNA processing protein
MKIQKLSTKNFPKQLLEIPDKPKYMYLKGTLPPDDAKILCVVGSRAYSSYGKDVCEKLIASLAGKNVAIVSGLALGIDSIAHEAALAAGLYTLALPGSGIEDTALYPSTNINLAHRILESGGGLMSEFEPNQKSERYFFPMRNRIMAAMSHAVLIIEAEIKSGTLITSKLATDYNRDVLTIPHSIYSKTGQGPHMLLRLGATPITKPEDLHEALGFEVQLTLPKTNREDCGEQEKMLLELLEEQSLPRDELIHLSRLTTSEANMYISLLEMKGYVKESLGEIRLIRELE